MRYDDERYMNDEEDNDLWDDELELDSGDSQPARFNSPQRSYASESSYSPYHDEEPANHEEDTYGSHGEAETQETRKDKDPDDYYSDAEPTTTTKPRRRGFFGKKKEDEEEEEEEEDDDEDNDYYDTDAEPVKPRRPKIPKPKLDPEDPDYWISEEETPLSGIMPPTGKKWKWKLAAALTFTALLIFAWIWFFRPHTDNAVKYGYIKEMERRGSLIKTFEGTMIPYKELGDPNPFYFEEMRFSVQSDSLAAQMKRMMLGCIPVRVEYEMYHHPLPWKGEEKMVVVKADTADPRKILPPEYR